MKRLWNLAWVFISYPLIAGTAWYWVLGIHFPFWKILVIAGLQTAASVVALVIAALTAPPKADDKEAQK